MTTQAQAHAPTSNQAPSFRLKELPNAILGLFGLRTESELPFETQLQEGPFSIRHYPAHAEVRHEVAAPRDEAVDQSFEALHAYISGQNTEAKEFAMTTPVLQRPRRLSEWSTAFYLKGRIEDLPLPRASNVKLYAATAETMAAIRFTGRLTESAVRKHIEKLLRWMNEKGLRAAGEAQIAAFDQPFSVPFFRRNEILIPLDVFLA